MSDQAQEQSVEDRLASYFSADAGTPAEPEAATQDASASEEGDSDTQALDPDTPEQTADDADSGFEEIELDGETYKVPPKLRDAVLRQADYTRKTQEVAFAASQVQQQQQALQAQAQFSQATAQEQQQLQQLESQLAQYRALDWAGMDTDTLTRARHQMDTLKEQAAGLRDGLNNKASQFQQYHAQLRQQQVQQGLEYLRKSIPKFDADTVQALRGYGASEGFTAPELENMLDPRVVKLMWKAQQFDTLKSQQKSAIEAVKKAPPVIRPGAQANQPSRNVVRVKQATDRLKKTGSVDAFSEALLARGFK
jgi:hypothetical protein